MQQRISDEIVKETPKIMTHIEAAWLAGVIDGEGSIGLYDYGKEGRRVLIQMSNTNLAFVERMKEIIGCGNQVKRTNVHLSHKGRKPMYQYTLKGSARCYVILKQILPYLIIKKSLAERIIFEIENNPFGRWKNASDEYRKKSSQRMKETWKNPYMRKRRIEGMKKYYEMKRI